MLDNPEMDIKTGDLVVLKEHYEYSGAYHAASPPLEVIEVKDGSIRARDRQTGKWFQADERAFELWKPKQ